MVFKQLGEALDKGRFGEGQLGLAEFKKMHEDVNLFMDVLVQRPGSDYSVWGKMALMGKVWSLAKLGATAITQAPMDLITNVWMRMVDRGSMNILGAYTESMLDFGKIAARHLSEEQRIQLANTLELCGTRMVVLR